MSKIRKNVKRKKYQFSRNRKRMNKTSKQLPKNACDLIEKNWSRKKSTPSNMRMMGLVYDVNQALPIVPAQAPPKTRKNPPPKKEVVELLEKDANEPRQPSIYKLTNNQLEFITEMMDKYGENYKKMAQDKKNYEQFTWKQFRNKVEQFKKSTEQFSKFLQDRKGKDLDTSAINTCVDDEGEW